MSALAGARRTGTGGAVAVAETKSPSCSLCSPHGGHQAEIMLMMPIMRGAPNGSLNDVHDGGHLDGCAGLNHYLLPAPGPEIVACGLPEGCPSHASPPFI